MENKRKRRVALLINVLGLMIFSLGLLNFLIMPESELITFYTFIQVAFYLLGLLAGMILINAGVSAMKETKEIEREEIIKNEE